MAKNTFIDKEKKQIHAVRNRKHKTKQNTDIVTVSTMVTGNTTVAVNITYYLYC